MDYLKNLVTRVVITSAYREGDHGVHGTVPCRGLDIRSFIYEKPRHIVDVLNETFSYDFQRPGMKAAMYHDSGHGRHIHLQVHDHTVQRGRMR